MQINLSKSCTATHPCTRVRYCFEFPKDDDSDSQVRVSRKLDNAVMTAWLIRTSSKGDFFSESAIRFSNLQISKKKFPNYYPELEI